MSEQSNGEGEQSHERHEAEIAKVLAFRQRIEDAYESGSGLDVHALIVEMHENCDQAVIVFVEAQMRAERRLP